MAGRGRGRGKGTSFNLQSFGLQKSDLLTTRNLEPPPLYPPLVFKPIASNANDVQSYLIAIKQELRLHLKNSRFSIDCRKKRSTVVKYSDKYENIVNKSSTSETLQDLDVRLFPEELQKKKIVKVKKKGNVDIQSKLDSLQDDKEDEKSDKSDDEAAEEEDEEAIDTEKPEEEIEEETDYALSYFDNGEGYLEDADEDDEPTY